MFADRYHSRVLKTPLEVKNCLRYVLLNGRRHAAQQGRRIGPDWFDPCPSAARSWLLATGWREKRGPISIADTPGRRYR